jgi:hypothetical protein
MSESEILLTQSEIAEIESFAKNNPIYKSEFVTNIGNDLKTLYRISPKHELILIKGNKFTGFEHIHLRHEFWTVEPFNKDNPSRFKTNSIPWIDYINIADSIYSPENINPKNKRPELFDYYTGQHIHKDNTTAVYNLLTYKDSKIIHTLFPEEKTNNTKKPKKFKFKRGHVTAETPISGICEIKIPYFNEQQELKYSLLICKCESLKLEKAIILIHDKNGSPTSYVFFDERPLTVYDSLTKELFAYQYNDLINLEKAIMQVDRQINPAP